MSLPPRMLAGWAWLALACLAILISPLSASAADQWAVLIGVKEHEMTSYNLRYPMRDVNLVEKVLVTRAGMDPKHILRMTDDSPPELRPTLVNLTREVPKFLGKARPDDRVLVFYSGHGVLVGDKTCLVPRDFREAMAEQSGLPVSEFRNWLGRDNCRATVKFLILDCCHAAADASAKSLDSEEVARAVEVGDIPGAVILASCRGREKSFEWPEREQGLFTYWLSRALEGAATNGDGNVSFDRLNTYVHERVSAISRVRFSRPQTPVRYGEVEGDPPVLVLTPESEATFCRRIAEDLDVDIRRKKVKSVGVFEFYVPPGRREEELGRAPLSRFLAEQVQTHLKALAGTEYAVVGVETMAESAKGLGVDQVRLPDQLQQIGRRGKAAGVVFGVIRQLPERYSVRCELVSTESGQELGQAGGVLALKAERLGDFSQSMDLRESPPGDSVDPNRLRFARRQSNVGHPLLDPKFPFRMEVWSGGKKKEFSVVNQESAETGQVRSEIHVGAVKDEEFDIRILNGSDMRVGVRLHVDGFNTLDQVRQLTDEGRAWVLAPSKEAYRFEGWYFRKGSGAEKAVVPYELRRFKFVDVGESVAARNNFTQGIGLISAAFFEEGARSIAVGEANERVQTDLKETPFRFGKCLGIVHVRYVEEKK